MAEYIDPNLNANSWVEETNFAELEISVSGLAPGVDGGWLVHGKSKTEKGEHNMEKALNTYMVDPHTGEGGVDIFQRHINSSLTALKRHAIIPNQVLAGLAALQKVMQACAYKSVVAKIS